jgi:hypothetical protein
MSTIPTGEIDAEIVKLNAVGFNKRTLNVELQETPFFQIQDTRWGGHLEAACPGTRFSRC